MPSRALSNIDLQKYAKELKIAFFRGVFMRNNLPTKVNRNECAIVNLDSNDGPGSHWVTYKKRNNLVIYFDSYGNLPPPKELVSYFGNKCSIHYNYSRYQPYNSVKCGHLCLAFLYEHEQS